ncbi:MAG: recombination regulator RecX [Gammaproteobacteria bacterium]|nr:recombination regulator RecX [Gammaproteobacteria bacterium]
MVSQSVREAAMNLLARREHSTRELRDKLLVRGFEKDEITPALQLLSREGLLSDERFTESFIHWRMERGSGPLKIRAELRQRGVADEIIANWLDERDRVWLERAEAVRCKKFGTALPVDYKEKARQTRFLQYRGFNAEQTRYVMRDDE